VVALGPVRLLRALVAEIAALEAHIREQLALHPDGPIFRSLPRAGTVRAAALLAEIGDCRARFPTPETLAAVAGAVPSTRASGQHHVVTFRWACDKPLRQALVDFAQDSVRASPWAAHLYRRHRQQRKTHPHAA
jgi:transposase